MTTQDKATAQLVLERMAVPGFRRVYVLGSFASPVTFSSQQMRAFNLIWALFTAEQLSDGDNVAVVGGGLAGITAAAAAALKQCKVTIFEKASQSLYLQRGNFTRYVHPNILNWPEQGSEVADTAFPVLNWHAARVDDVVSQIEEQWVLFSNRIDNKHFGYEVDSITPAGVLTSVKANRIYGAGPTLLDQQYKCVIIAVGFGLEKSLPNVRFRSYWDNDGLHRELEPEQKVKRFLISGCGDGGLIDALRLRITNFKHEHLVSEFFSADDMKAVRESLREIEKESRLTAEDHNTSQKLYKAYKDLPIPSSLQEKIRLRLRPDTHVTLNSPNPTPLSLRSSILNRFATFLLIEYGDLHYAQGMVQIKIENEEYEVTFSKDGGISYSQKYDEVILRHGPNASVNRLLTENTTNLLRSMWDNVNDPTAQRLWNGEFFPKSSSEAVITSTKAIDLAAQQFSGAFPLLYHPQHVNAVAVANFGGIGGYVVTLKKGSGMLESARKKFLAGIPVTYVEEAKSASPQRLLEMGTEIYNYDCTQRTGNDSQVVGSLGCFVTLNTGEVAILSTNTVLAGANMGAIGDRIARFRNDETGEANMIAKLSSFIPITPSQPNFADAAVAVLDPRIEYRLMFPNESELPALSGASAAVIGQRVFKLGRTTGLTYGTVTDIDADIRVHYGSGRTYDFEGVIAIESSAGETFFAPGDGGAIIASVEGRVLGLGFASGERITFVCPIMRVLEYFECELLLPTPG